MTDPPDRLLTLFLPFLLRPRRLLQIDPTKRLGHNGAAEIRAHPFFASVCWETLLQRRAAFIPTTEHEEDTSYFAAKPFSQKSVAADLADHLARRSAPRIESPPGPSLPLSEAPSARTSTGTRGMLSIDLPPGGLQPPRPSMSSQGRPSLMRVSHGYKRGSSSTAQRSQLSRVSTSKGVTWLPQGSTAAYIRSRPNTSGLVPSPQKPARGFEGGGSGHSSAANSLDLVRYGPANSAAAAAASAAEIAASYITDFTGDEIRVQQGGRVSNVVGSAADGIFLGPISVALPQTAAAAAPGTGSSGSSSAAAAAASGGSSRQSTHAAALANAGALTAPSGAAGEGQEPGFHAARQRSFLLGDYEIDSPNLSPNMSPTSGRSPTRGFELQRRRNPSGSAGIPPLPGSRRTSNHNKTVSPAPSRPGSLHNSPRGSVLGL